MKDVAHTQGVELNDQAILPVRTIRDTSDADALDQIVLAGEDFAKKAPDHKVSAMQDLEAGRPMEIDETLGQALRTARNQGLILPVLSAIYPPILAIGRLR